MSKLKVKPFTFFLICLSLIFLILYPRLITNRLKAPEEDPFAKELPEWSGIITVWDIPYLQTGRGNHVQWLNRYISRFEKKYPGVFVDIRTMSYERMALYFNGGQNNGIVPDIISLGVYDQTVNESILTDLLPFFREDELGSLRAPALQRAMSDGHMYALPWMMGCYGLYVNMDAVLAAELESVPEKLNITFLDEMARKLSFQKKSGRKTISHFGFVTYSNISSRPMLSMILPQNGKISNNSGYEVLQSWANEQGILPSGIINMSYSQAFSLLAIENRAGIMLGNSKVLFDLRRLQESGKGINYKVYPLPLDEDTGFYIDQVAAYGLIKQDNSDKEQLCILFLKSLLDQEMQSRLNELGMFSVLNDIQLYSDDPEMEMLELSLDNIVLTPFGNGRYDAQAMWEFLEAGLGKSEAD